MTGDASAEAAGAPATAAGDRLGVASVRVIAKEKLKCEFNANNEPVFVNGAVADWSRNAIYLTAVLKAQVLELSLKSYSITKVPHCSL